jgi:ADP-ribose pyrophosphatase
VTAVTCWLTPGENRAVDAAVVVAGWLLLVRRGDGGGWAVPGGMVEAGETEPVAMWRELLEETGVDLRGVEPVMLGDRFVVDDPRGSRDAWITTRLGLFVVPDRVGVAGGDDADEAAWFPVGTFDELDALVRARTGVGLYPAHRPLVNAVCAAVGGGVR